MADQRTFTLDEIADARGELDALAAELETVKLQLDQLTNKLPSRACLCRTVFVGTAPIWALFGAVVLLLLR